MQGHRQKGVYHPVSESKRAHLEKLRTTYSFFSCRVYVCMVTHIARVWINRGRLPVLHVVS